MTIQQRPERTLGPGHDTFWEHCAKGELWLPRCTACGELAWPLVAACEHCGSAEFDWQQMSGKAKLVSWCSFTKDYYRGVLPMPHDVIVVELSEGPLFLSNPLDFGLDDCRAGMAVTVQFMDCEDAVGRFKLPVFVRIPEDSWTPDQVRGDGLQGPS